MNPQPVTEDAPPLPARAVIRATVARCGVPALAGGVTTRLSSPVSQGLWRGGWTSESAAYGHLVDFVIRAPTALDVLRLQAIEDAADALFLQRFQPEVWWPAGPGADRLDSPGFVFVVAETPESAAVGFVHVLEVDGLAHLEQVAVRPEYGRRGLGRALLHSAKGEAAARGHDRMTLRTYADVPWNAPFYAHNGFVESEPDTTFLRGLIVIEENLGLHRYGRRIQMTADLLSPYQAGAPASDG